ncbi:PAS domain-containing protein [uncultured Nostoc sp.]|uniref:PAS domain-containing protein n=1 Tax=uncultured Nostoc sp. TaxID=340711 RepID=UPI0035CA12CE
MTPEQFLEIARVLPEPLLLVSSDGQLLATNQPVADMLALRRQQLRGKTLFELVTESANDVVKYLQACSSSRAMVIGSLTLRKNDGQTLICRSQGAVIQPWSPESSALILLRLENRTLASSNFVLLNEKIDELAKEVQRRKQAEEALKKANQELEIRVEERTTV